MSDLGNSVRCVWCGSQRTSLLTEAIVAPWTVEIDSLKSRKLDTCLLRCLLCDLQFFTRRYSSSELQLLYSDYRGEKYLTRRRRWEPWYTDERNHLIGHDRRVETSRQLAVESFLLRFLDRGTLLRIVDWGGDEGQFIPQLPNIQFAGVFEISGRPVRPGISSLPSLEQVRDASPNLIMLCHVLEHLTEPRTEFESILSILGPGGHLYIEVPLDGHRLRSPTPARLTSLFRSSRVAFILSDFVSQVSRFQFGWQSRFRLIKQSEHLQFFTLPTIKVIAQELKLNVLGSFTYSPDKSVGTPETLGVLLQKQNS